jgi:hypothetical protein
MYVLRTSAYNAKTMLIAFNHKKTVPLIMQMASVHDGSRVSVAWCNH